MARGAAVVEQDARPIGRYRLPPPRPDGIVRRRGTAQVRIIHLGDEPAVVRAWPVSGAVRRIFQLTGMLERLEVVDDYAVVPA